MKKVIKEQWREYMTGDHDMKAEPQLVEVGEGGMKKKTWIFASIFRKTYIGGRDSH